jgi:hypothetical protein
MVAVKVLVTGTEAVNSFKTMELAEKRWQGTQRQ